MPYVNREQNTFGPEVTSNLDGPRALEAAKTSPKTRMGPHESAAFYPEQDPTFSYVFLNPQEGALGRNTPSEGELEAPPETFDLEKAVHYYEKRSDFWTSRRRAQLAEAIGAVGADVADAPFVGAIVSWQMRHNLGDDGMFGARSAEELAQDGDEFGNDILRYLGEAPVNTGGPTRAPDLGEPVLSFPKIGMLEALENGEAALKKFLDYQWASAALENDELTAADIKRIRDYASSLDDEEEAGRIYLALSRKTPYANQLNNEILGQASTDRNDSGRDRGRLGPAMCNVTSLGMALQTLGVTKDELIALMEGKTSKRGESYKDFIALQTRNYHKHNEVDLSKWQYEDLVELARRFICPQHARVDDAARKAICDALGVTHAPREMKGGTSPRGDKVNFTSEAYWAKVQEEIILKGGAAYIGVYHTGGTHIVRLQEVTGTGIVVDDPNGRGVYIPSLKKIQYSTPGGAHNARDQEHGPGMDVEYSFAQLHFVWYLTAVTLEA